MSDTSKIFYVIRTKPIITIGQGNKLNQEEITSTHCVIIGYIQPGPFFTKALPTIMQEEDGLLDRFLICCPKINKFLSSTLKEKRENLKLQKIKDCKQILQVVNDIHDCTGNHLYTLSKDALREYELFHDECAKSYVSNWEVANDLYDTNSKSTRMALRWVVYIYIQYL